MIDQLRNKWALGVILFSLFTMAVYLFMPMFRLAIFGVDTGAEYIKLIYKVKSFSDIFAFLLPFIGGLGAIVTVLMRGKGPHLLTVSFSLLPIMFFAFFLYQIDGYLSKQIMGLEVVGLTDVIGSGIWFGLVSSVLACVCSILSVVSDRKK